MGISERIGVLWRFPPGSVGQKGKEGAINAGRKLNHQVTHPTWFRRLIIQEGHVKWTTSESLQATQGPSDMDTPFRGRKQLLMHPLLPQRPSSEAEKSPTPSSLVHLRTQIL